MGYTTLPEVKSLCRITDTSHDTEITTTINDAGYYSDALLQLHETVPLTGSIPNEVAVANKYLAAAMFYYHNPTTDSMTKQAELWWKIGETILTNYIIHKYFQGEMAAT